jgi:hypothetical protein
LAEDSSATATAVAMEVAKNVKVNLEGNVNKALDQIGSVYKEAIADENAVVYNGTRDNVRFYCYNDSDFIRAISARKPVVPPGYTGLLNKGPISYGPTIQVMINDKDGPYYVKRRHAYIWDGVGFKEVVPKEGELNL